MIKDYLVKYRYLRDVFKDNFELYSRKHNYDSLNRERYFDTPCDFYNLVIVEYFSTNHLLTSPHFDIVALFTKFKKVKKIKHTLFDLLLDCDFEADDFEDGYCQTGKDNVTLTLEEAKKISDALEWVDGYMYSYAYKKVIEDFNKRIEQAQSGNV